MTDPEPEPSNGTQIPDRPDFPVEWNDDIEPTLLWSWDNFHSPLPRTFMTISVNSSSRSGMTEATKYLGTYRPGSRSKVVNGYPYGASTAAPMTEEEKTERAQRLDAQMTSVRANWDNEWLPEIEADLEEMKKVPYAELAPDALWQTVEIALALHTRHWNIHHRIVMPVSEQANRLDKICNEILGTKDESVAAILLHGTETLTVRSINNLEALADKARSTDQVCEILERDSTSTEIINALQEFEAGKEWLKQMKSYLYDFGYRCTGFDLSFPTWVEDQTFVLQIIRNLLQSASSESSSAHSRTDGREERLDEERDALLTKVRETGSSKPELLAQFELNYELGQQIWPLKEDHSHYIDQASTAIMRIVIAEVGRRLQASGAIGQADDVWYIDLDEAKAALTGEVAANLGILISERRAERERFSKITPPKYLGTFSPDHEAASEPENPKDPENPENQVESPGTLRGSAASKGEASGIARVVLSPDDFHKLSKGDVLVCRSTAPMWTPLFRIISALVSESGGILSHPAVVAREFNLPAVVGVPNATNLITDGQLITVSGTDGLVHTN